MYILYSTTKQSKMDSEKRLNPFFIIATNFNETSMALTHTESDYFNLFQTWTTAYLPFSK